MEPFRARATVSADGRMTMPAPPGMPAGEIEVVVSVPGGKPEMRRDPPSDGDTVMVIETNIDDMNPEVYGYLVDRLLEAGAKDAYLTPLVMKKGRPGVMVSVLADPSDAERLSAMLLAETTTLGVRIHRADRRKKVRGWATVDTAFGPVRVKVAGEGASARAAPEYEDCARIARERPATILEVYAAAQLAWDQRSKTQSQVPGPKSQV